MNIRIYQINLDRDDKREAFLSLESRKRIINLTDIDSAIYDCVFSGNVECEGLEEVFQMFNVEHPDGYAGRSLSVSDIVEIIDGDGSSKFYYCDSFGFKEVEFDIVQFLDTLKKRNSNWGHYCSNCTIFNGECNLLALSGRCKLYLSLQQKKEVRECKESGK